MQLGETNHATPTGGITNDTGAYVSGDVVGGLLRFDMSHFDGTIHRLLMVDDEAKAVDWTLYFYDEEPTEIADNAAFSLAAADLIKECGRVVLAAADQVTINSIVTNRASMKTHDGMPVFFNGNSLWCYMVIGGGATYTGTGALQLKATYWPDKAEL